MPGRFEKGHPIGDHPGMIARKVLGFEKQHYPSANLPTHCSGLFGTFGARQQQARAAMTGRRHEHPSLAPAHIGVGNQRETEPVPVKCDGFVIVSDKE